MYYKTYGTTGIKVSAVGFGGMRFDDEDVKAGRFEKCAEVALYAYEKGVNYFDSAPGYCADQSETITGIALSQMKRDEVYVTSKTNLGTLKGEATPDAFRARLEKSLERLRTDHIDFYHLWCMLSPAAYRDSIEKLYPFFEDAKRQGLIRHIVFSSHMQGDELQTVLGDGRFDGVLLGYNALNYRYRIKGIQSAAEHGMGVVVMNPLGGGMIPQNPDYFSYLAEGTDLTVAQAALRFVASQKEVSVTLNGMSTFAHVDDALRAIEGLQECSAQQAADALEQKGGLSENTLCTGCGYCLHCPREIFIPKFMDAYNHQLMGSDAVARLRNQWGIKASEAAACVACGKCETLCTQHLPIISRLREIAAAAK